MNADGGAGIGRTSGGGRARRALGAVGLVLAWWIPAPPANALEDSTSLDGVVGSVTDVVSDPIDGVTDTVADTTDAVTDSVDEVTDTVEDVTGTVGDAVDDTTGTVGDAVDDTTGSVGDAVEGVTDGVDAGGVDPVTGPGGGTETPPPPRGSIVDGSIGSDRGSGGATKGPGRATLLAGSLLGSDVSLASLVRTGASHPSGRVAPSTDTSAASSSLRPPGVITGGSSSPYAALLFALLLATTIGAVWWQRRGQRPRSYLVPFIIEPPD